MGESLGKTNPLNPTPKELEEQFQGMLQKSTEAEERNAKKLGFTTVEEYRKQHNIPGFVEGSYRFLKKKETEFSPMESLIRKWEKENLVLLDNNIGQIPQKTLIEPNSKFIPQMSTTFISHILQKAREKMINDRTYKKNHPILGAFREIRKIEIKHLGGADKLLFEVCVDKGSDKQQLVTFVMDSEGEISFPRD